MNKKNKEEVEILLQAMEYDIKRIRNSMKNKRYAPAWVGAYNIETDSKKIQKITRRG